MCFSIYKKNKKWINTGCRHRLVFLAKLWHHRLWLLHSHPSWQFVPHNRCHSILEPSSSHSSSEPIESEANKSKSNTNVRVHSHLLLHLWRTPCTTCTLWACIYICWHVYSFRSWAAAPCSQRRCEDKGQWQTDMSPGVPVKWKGGHKYWRRFSQNIFSIITNDTNKGSGRALVLIEALWCNQAKFSPWNPHFFLPRGSQGWCTGWWLSSTPWWLLCPWNTRTTAFHSDTVSRWTSLYCYRRREKDRHSELVPSCYNRQSWLAYSERGSCNWPIFVLLVAFSAEPVSAGTLHGLQEQVVLAVRTFQLRHKINS